VLALAGRPARAGQDDEYKTKGKPFSGTSKKGNLDEALDEAVKAALASTNVSDAQAKWTIKHVTGIKGGIAGRNEITVTIDAIVP
jgi:hypothetical protein